MCSRAVWLENLTRHVCQICQNVPPFHKTALGRFFHSRQLTNSESSMLRNWGLLSVWNASKIAAACAIASASAER